MPVFLKYGEIKGDAKEPAHRGWIELGSVQFGTSRRIDSGSREQPRGSPSISDVVVTKKSDSASVALQRAAVSGTEVTAFIDFVDPGGSVTLRLEMSGTLISSFSVSSGGDSPSESLTLSFRKVDFTNTPGTPPP